MRLPSLPQRFFHVYLFLVALAPGLAACGRDDLVDPPPVNAEIMNSAGIVDAGAMFKVECDGPDEEVRRLGTLCGQDTDFASWFGLHFESTYEGLGTAIGEEEGPLLLIFARASEDAFEDAESRAAALEYSAYVSFKGRGDVYETLERWKSAEAVTEGTVVTEHVQLIACDAESWKAQASFLWRSTTIRLAWFAGQPC